MDRVDWFFRQLVTEAELDGAFDDVETAMFNLALDWEFEGVFGSGTPAVVTEFSGTPNLTVDISAGSAYDQLGQRIRIPSTQNLDVSVDSLSVTTAVGTPGNEKIVSVFAKFDRALSDPRTDGNSNTVFFERDETFQFVVTQGAETASPPATPPALEVDAILLADIQRLNPQTQIFNANITPPGGSYVAISNRRQDAFVEVAGSLSIRENTVNAGLNAVLQNLVDHITDVGGAHAATAISATITTQWADSSGIVGTEVDAVLEEIIADLAAVAGSARVGADAIAGSPDSFSSGTIDSIFGEALTAINARARLASAETITGGWTFDTSPTTFEETIQSNVSGGVTDSMLTDQRTVASNFQLILDVPYAGTRRLRLYAVGTNIIGGGGLLATFNMVYSGTADNFTLDDNTQTGRTMAFGGAGEIDFIDVRDFASGAGTKDYANDPVTQSTYGAPTTSDHLFTLGGVWENDDQIRVYIASGLVAAGAADNHVASCTFPKVFPLAPTTISGLTNHILTNTSSPVADIFNAVGMSLISSSTAGGVAQFSSSFDIV